MPLNPRQQRFVLEYIRCGNATEAYRIAYDTDNDDAARAHGARLVANGNVKSAIEEARRAAVRQAGLNAERWAEEVGIVAHSDIGDILDFSGEEVKLRPANQITSRGRRAISGIKVRRYVEGRGEAARTVEVVEFKLWSKPDGLQKVGQNLGLLKERVELTGADGGPLQTEANHDHHLNPAAFQSFLSDVARAGVGGIPADGGAQPLDQEGTHPPS